MHICVYICTYIYYLLPFPPSLYIHIHTWICMDKLRVNLAVLSTLYTYTCPLRYAYLCIHIHIYIYYLLPFPPSLYIHIHTWICMDKLRVNLAVLSTLYTYTCPLRDAYMCIYIHIYIYYLLPFPPSLYIHIHTWICIDWLRLSGCAFYSIYIYVPSTLCISVYIYTQYIYFTCCLFRPAYIYIYIHEYV